MRPGRWSKAHPPNRSQHAHARTRARTHARTHALQELRPFLRCGVPPGTPERACRSAGGWGRKKGVVKRVQDIPRGARFMRKGGLEAAGATCGARARASAPRHQNVLSKHSARPEPSATSACAAAALCHLYTRAAWSQRYVRACVCRLTPPRVRVRHLASPPAPLFSLQSKGTFLLCWPTARERATASRPASQPGLSHSSGRYRVTSSTAQHSTAQPRQSHQSDGRARGAALCGHRDWRAAV